MNKIDWIKNKVYSMDRHSLLGQLYEQDGSGGGKYAEDKGRHYDMPNKGTQKDIPEEAVRRAVYKRGNV